MAIDFNNQDAIGRLNDLFNNPTGWGSRVIDTLTAAFGASNPFNSAALADTGDSEGQVPVLDSAGVQERHLKPATVALGGAVRISPTTTNRNAAGGFPLVMFAVQALTTLRAADPNQNLFGIPRINRGTQASYDTTLQTNAGFVLLVGANDGNTPMRISGATFMNVVAPDITVGNASAALADGAKRGDDIRPLTTTELGGVFRFGLYLPGFGQLRTSGLLFGSEARNASDFAGQSSDLVIAFKEETPREWRLNRVGGEGDNRAYFIQIPAQ